MKILPDVESKCLILFSYTGQIIHGDTRSGSNVLVGGCVILWQIHPCEFLVSIFHKPHAGRSKIELRGRS